ncbi:unnamed protein product [Phytophthora fragariaefolia]|uniref:Unnamed protein product n=1 Tax=Phytophthora fragariaefolia TaxID=1490495 RepID=A0A9W6Y6L7_9STRA|nr:unnamed protein product [Phytophthora fragariaefolia]
MNNGVRSAIEHGVTDLIIVGDSRLAIQQLMGVIACRKETLQVKLTQHKELTAQPKLTRYMHVVWAYNAAAYSLATEALESQVTKVVLSESRKTELKALNKTPEVLYVDEQALAETDLPAQRMQSIPQTEPHAVSQSRRTSSDCRNHRAVSPSELPRLNRRRASRDNPHVPWGQEGLLLGRSVRHGNTARPSLRRLQHQQRETPFKGLFAGQCARRATLPAAVYGFFDTPAKASAREHIAAAVPVFVYGLRDRQGHEQHQGTGRRRSIRGICVPTLWSADYDTPRPRSKVHERNFQGVGRTNTSEVKSDTQLPTSSQRTAGTLRQIHRADRQCYVEDPLQQDWDDIAEKMAHAINNSMDTTRKETHFYLVHGWDAQSTLNAMTSSLRLGDGSLTNATAW